MNIHKIVYNGIRTISIVSILVLLSIGFILPMSYVQALVINPIILVFLMAIFAVSHEKLKSVSRVDNITRLPEKSTCKLCSVSKAA